MKTILKCKSCFTPVTQLMENVNKRFDMLNIIKEDEELDNGETWVCTQYETKPNVFKLVEIQTYPHQHTAVSKIAYKMDKTMLTENVTLKEYQGCCSYDYAEIKCKCGDVIGFGKDDCWQNRSTYIYKSNVFKGGNL